MTTTDAPNRSLRTILQGAAVVALMALGTAVLEVLNAGNFSWQTLGVSALTAVLTAVLAYFHRTLLDPSRLPSAQPPADKHGEGGVVSAWDVLVIAVLVLIVVAVLALLGVV